MTDGSSMKCLSSHSLIVTTGLMLSHQLSLFHFSYLLMPPFSTDSISFKQSALLYIAAFIHMNHMFSLLYATSDSSYVHSFLNIFVLCHTCTLMWYIHQRTPSSFFSSLQLSSAFSAHMSLPYSTTVYTEASDNLSFIFLPTEVITP